MLKTAPAQTPCQAYKPDDSYRTEDEGADDPWFSTRKSRMKWAAEQCGECPLTIHTECGKQGWEELYGVWGGLTPSMRRSIDPGRYEAVRRADAAAKMEEDMARVLALAKIGLNASDTAEQVGLSKRTVERYRKQFRENGEL